MAKGSLYMGYRPTEIRVRKEIMKLIRRGKIKSIEVNADRDTITYEFYGDAE